MANTTLTTDGATHTFDTVAGTSYAIGQTGDFKGGDVLYEHANAATPTVFGALDSAKSGSRSFVWDATGSKLKATRQGGNGTSSINIEVTALT